MEVIECPIIKEIFGIQVQLSLRALFQILTLHPLKHKKIYFAHQAEKHIRKSNHHINLLFCKLIKQVSPALILNYFFSCSLKFPQEAQFLKGLILDLSSVLQLMKNLFDFDFKN